MHSMRFPTSRGRRRRRPEHRWFVSNKPWEIQPIAIAPVLPGERLNRITFQARIVTDPLVSSIVGWWAEHYWFYVPISLLTNYSNFIAEVESGALNDVFASDTTDDAWCYYNSDTGVEGMNWVRRCMDTIVANYFREEDEESATIEIRSGTAAAKVNTDDVSHSLRLLSAYPGTDGGALGATQRAQEDAYRTYTYLREQGMVQMDYEQWIQTYNVSAPQAIRRRRPYLLRYQREWQYPSNVVNQATGIPVTAVSWVISGRADARRFITEPGFIVGVSVNRPKVYRGNQNSHACSVMDRLKYWLPAVLRDDELTSLRTDSATTSPLYDGTIAADHFIDVRDILIHGDQFVRGSAQVNAVALPTAGAEAKYATEAMADALFTDPAGSGLFFVRQDGVARFDISAASEDTVDATAQS